MCRRSIILLSWCMHAMLLLHVRAADSLYSNDAEQQQQQQQQQQQSIVSLLDNEKNEISRRMNTYEDATSFAIECSATLTNVPNDVSAISQQLYAEYLHSLCSLSLLSSSSSDSNSGGCPMYSFQQLPFTIQVIFAGSTCANVQPVNMSPTCPSYDSQSMGGVPDMAIYLGEERPVMEQVYEQVFFLCYDSFDALLKYSYVQMPGEPTPTPSMSPTKPPTTKPPTMSPVSGQTPAPMSLPRPGPTPYPSVSTLPPFEEPAGVGTGAPTLKPNTDGGGGVPSRDNTPTVYPSLPYEPEDLTLVLPFYYQIAIPAEADLMARDTRENTDSNDILDDLRYAFEVMVTQVLEMINEDDRRKLNIRPPTMTIGSRKRQRELQWQPLDTVTFELIEDGSLSDCPCPIDHTCQVLQSKFYLIYSAASDDQGNIPAVDSFTQQLYTQLRNNMYPDSDYFTKLVDNEFINETCYGGDGLLPPETCLDGEDCEKDRGLSTVEYSVLGLSLMIVLGAYPSYLAYVRYYAKPSVGKKDGGNAVVQLLPIGGHKVMAVFHNQNQPGITQSASSSRRGGSNIAQQTITAEWEDWEVTNNNTDEEEDDPIVCSLEQGTGAVNEPAQQVVLGYNRLSFNPQPNNVDYERGNTLAYTNAASTDMQLNGSVANPNHINQPSGTQLTQTTMTSNGMSQPLPTFSKSLSSSASFSFAENTRKLQSVVEAGDWESARIIAKTINQGTSGFEAYSDGQSGSASNSHGTPVAQHSHSSSTSFQRDNSTRTNGAEVQSKSAAIANVRSVSPLSSMAQSHSESSVASEEFKRTRYYTTEVNEDDEERSESSGSLSHTEAVELRNSGGPHHDDRSVSSGSANTPTQVHPNDGNTTGGTNDNITEHSPGTAAEFRRQIVALLENLAPGDAHAADSMIAQFEGREYDLLQELQIIQNAKLKESGSNVDVANGNLSDRAGEGYGVFTSDEEDSEAEQEKTEDQSHGSDILEDEAVLGYALASRSLPQSQPQSQGQRNVTDLPQRRVSPKVSPRSSSSSAEAQAALTDYYLKATTAHRTLNEDHSTTSSREELPFYPITSSPVRAKVPAVGVDDSYSSNSSSAADVLDELDSAVARGDWDAVQRNAKHIQDTAPSRKLGLNTTPSFQRSSSSVGDVSSVAQDEARLHQLEQQINLEDWQSIMNSAELFADDSAKNGDPKDGRNSQKQQRVSARRGAIIRQSLQGVEPEVNMVKSSLSLDEKETGVTSSRVISKVSSVTATNETTQVEAVRQSMTSIQSSVNTTAEMVDPLAMEWAIAKGLRNLDGKD